MPGPAHDLQADLQFIIKEQRQHVCLLERANYSMSDPSECQPAYMLHLIKQINDLKNNGVELIGQLERIHNSVSKIEQRHINEQLLLQRENLQIKDELKLLDEKMKGETNDLQKQLSSTHSQHTASVTEHNVEMDKLRTELRSAKLEKRESERQVREITAQLTALQAQSPKIVKMEPSAKRRCLSANEVDSNCELSMLSSDLDSSALETPQSSQSSYAGSDLNDSYRLQAKAELEYHQMQLALVTELEQKQADDVKRLQMAKLQSCQQLTNLQSNIDNMQYNIRNLLPAVSTLSREQASLRSFCLSLPAFIQDAVTATTSMVCRAIKDVSQTNEKLVKKYANEMKLRKKYHNELVHLKGNIRVLCRVRPVIKEDGDIGASDICVQCNDINDGLLTIQHRNRSNNVELDKVFDQHATQLQVFDEVSDLVMSCVDGYNVCIFAYGQTGSGKTHTMEGSICEDSPGINQRALALLFNETTAREEWIYTITVSAMEIYNEQIRDLLCGSTSTERLEVKMNPEGGLYVPGLTYTHVQSLDEINEVFEYGKENRATAATDMNEHSSRSHAILQVSVFGQNTLTGSKTQGKLNLVDLAGSERVAKSGAHGARLKEVQNINKSLSCLADVIHALRARQSHIPFRNSKLTYLLQDSLGGDSKTMMIVHLSPVTQNASETMASLNFAQRVRSVELGQATLHAHNTASHERAPSPGDTKNMRVLTPRNNKYR